MLYLLLLCFLVLSSVLEYSIDQVASEVNSPFPVVNVPFYLNALATPDPHWDISGALGCEITAGTAKAAVLCKRQGSFVVKLSSGTTGAPGTFVEVPLIVAQPEPIYRWTAAFVGEGAVLASNIDLSAVVMREVELRVWVRNFVTITADEAAPHTWGYHVAGADAVLTPDDPYGLAAVVPDASEAAITRALRRTGLFPDVLFSESHHLIPLSSVSWNPEAAYFSMKIHTGRVGNARFSVTSGLGGDAGSISDAFYTVHVLANRPEPVAGTDEASLRQRRALYPPFMRPTDPATAAGIVNGAGTPARDFRRDLLLPPHAFLVAPDWGTSGINRDHYLFSLGRPEDAVPLHLHKADVSDFSAPQDGPDSVLPFAQFLMLGSLTVVRAAGATALAGPLYAHIPFAEAEFAAQQFDMERRIIGYKLGMPMPGHPDFVGPSFVKMSDSIARLMPSSEGTARTQLQGVPMSEYLMAHEYMASNEQIAFSTLVIEATIVPTPAVNVSITQYSYYHVVAAMCRAAVLFAEDPESGKVSTVPDWETLDAEGYLYSPLKRELQSVSILTTLYSIWRSQLSPSFATISVVKAMGKSCQFMRVDNQHHALDSSMFTSTELSYIDQAESLSNVDNDFCNTGFEFIPFGSMYQDALFFYKNRLHRAFLGGSAQAENLLMLGHKGVAQALPDDEQFVHAFTTGDGTIFLETSKHRWFMSFTGGITTSEIFTLHIPNLHLYGTMDWGKLVGAVLLPPTMAEPVRPVNVMVQERIAQAVEGHQLPECAVTSFRRDGVPEILLDISQKYTAVLGTRIDQSNEDTSLTHGLSDLTNLNLSSISRTLIQPMKAGIDTTLTASRNGYVGLVVDRSLTSGAENGLLASGGYGGEHSVYEGTLDRIAVTLRVLRDTPAVTTTLTMASVLVTPACVVSTQAVASALGSKLAKSVLARSNSAWVEFPRGKPGDLATLISVGIWPQLGRSAFAFDMSTAFTKGCPLGKRVLQPGVSFDPADCPEYSSVDGSKHFITYNPRIHGARDQIDQTLWKVLPDGTRSDTIFEYPFNAIGCPIRLFHDDQHGFRPSLNLIDAGLETPLSNTDFVISETQGRTDFGYSLTADEVACVSQPLTWSEARVLSTARYEKERVAPHYYDAWQPSIHVPCTLDVASTGRPRAGKRTPLEVFGRDVYVDRFKNPNSIVFPPGGRDGVFIFRARVVEPGVSQCDLYTDFAIDVYGAVVPVSDAMLIIGLTLLVLILSLFVGYMVFVWYLRREDQRAAAILQAQRASEEGKEPSATSTSVEGAAPRVTFG